MKSLKAPRMVCLCLPLSLRRYTRSGPCMRLAASRSSFLSLSICIHISILLAMSPISKVLFYALVPIVGGSDRFPLDDKPYSFVAFNCRRAHKSASIMIGWHYKMDITCASICIQCMKYSELLNGCAAYGCVLGLVRALLPYFHIHCVRLCLAGLSIASILVYSNVVYRFKLNAAHSTLVNF